MFIRSAGYEFDVTGHDTKLGYRFTVLDVLTVFEMASHRYRVANIKPEAKLTRLTERVELEVVTATGRFAELDLDYRATAIARPKRPIGHLAHQSY